MILKALVDYYDRLAAEDIAQVSPFGFSRQGIDFCVVLGPAGELVDVQDLRTPSGDGKRLIGRALAVPHYGSKRTSGVRSYFLWEKSGYVFGRDIAEEEKGPKKLERLREQFKAFGTLHLGLRETIRHDGFTALCKFLAKWEPEGVESLPNWKDVSGGNLVFRLQGQQQYLHEARECRDAWLGLLSGGTPDLGYCLITGQKAPIARLHPAIKNVRDPGGQAEKSLVSINTKEQPAFGSRGKEQAFNAPVSEDAAFRYAEGLNRLLSNPRRRVFLSDCTVAFWSERPSALEDEIFGIFDGADAEDMATLDRLRGFFDRVRRAGDGATFENGEVPFYVLGLAPNAARVSVRFWLVGTVQQFAERLGQHLRDLEVVGLPRSPTLRHIVLQTARLRNGWPDEESVSPLLSGATLRSVLGGTPYPQTLMSALLQRIGAEGTVSPQRAAILKAILIRNWSIPMEVYLNKSHPEKAYHCGRLLAVLAFAQEQALGTVNTGIVRRNLGSVMASPGLFLGRLQRAAEVGHVPKLEPSDLQVFVRDELKAINVMLRDDLPLQLDLRLQGVFALGFYQQLQYLDFIGQQVSEKRRHRTTQGDWVRSKLEVKTADALAKFGLVYTYEMTAILPSGGERWPDFVVLGKDKPDDLYIEVLGIDDPEYDQRWQVKRSAYEEVGITESGGPRGRLIVLDFRKTRFDELAVANALRACVTNEHETSQQSSERN